MKISKEKLDVMRARKCMRLSDLGVSKITVKRINNGLEVKPYTVGKIANSLQCDVTDIIEEANA